MKFAWLVLLALCSATALAQDPFDDPGPPDGEDGPPPGVGPGPGFNGEIPPPLHRGAGEFRKGPAGPPVDGPFVQRLMERMKYTRPEDYARLQKLRAEDPEAFRAELLALLKRERLERLREQFPQIAAAIDTLAPAERDRLMEQIQGGGRPDQGPGGHAMKGPVPPELQQADMETRRLANAYRNAGTDEEKARIRAELQAKLGEVFDLREKGRAEEVRAIEERLARLRESTANRSAHRDEIIDRRLRELTQEDDLKW